MKTPKKNKKIVFIGEFLLSFPGGAEKSIYNELLKLSKDKSKKEIVAILLINVVNQGLLKEII